ncbi:MAG TPA: hypothetical protein PK490_14190 [Prosthecobacter sp.]|nr:hypothetical protein [Prosthecobacter sp.]HRK15427.1 hypothetical protein [Prosthecobacter sp.]
MPCPYLPTLKVALNTLLSLWPDCPLKHARGDSLAEYLASIEKIIRGLGEEESAARKAGEAAQDDDVDGDMTPVHFPRLTHGVANWLDAFVFAAGHAPKDACNALTGAFDDSAGVTNLLVIYATMCRLPDEKAETDAWWLLLQRMHVVAKRRAIGALNSESIAEEATSEVVKKIFEAKNNAAWPPRCAPAAWVVNSLNKAVVSLLNKAANESTRLSSLDDQHDAIAEKMGGDRFPRGISDRTWLLLDSLEKVKDMEDAGNKCLTPREIEHLEWRVLYLVTKKTAADRAVAALARDIVIRSLTDAGWTFRTAGLSWDKLPVTREEVAKCLGFTIETEAVYWHHLRRKIRRIINP